MKARRHSRVVVLGNATVDLVQTVAALPRPGETVLSAGVTRCAGGKGLNQALACARTGARTTLVAPVGRDPDADMLRMTIGGEPSLAARWLEREALATDLSVIIVAAGGENMIVSSAQAARSVTPDEASAVAAGLGDGDILLLQGNLSATTTLSAAVTGKEHGARVILNTAPVDWDMTPLLPHLHVVISNEGEAEAMLAGTGHDRSETADRRGGRLARALHATGPSVAIVTLGAAGAFLATASRTLHAPAPSVEAVDTAGAGDVTVGTFAGLLAQGVSLEEALTLAVAAASLSVTRAGTTPSFPTAGELRGLRSASHQRTGVPGLASALHARR